MTEFDLLKNVKDLQDIYNSIKSAEKSLLFVLIYDLKKETEVNIALINYFKEELNNPINKIGVLTEHSYDEQKLDVVQRDLPDVDLENLFIKAKDSPENIALYDTLLRAVDEFKDDHTRKVVILILNAKRKGKGAAHIDNFSLFDRKNIKLVAICENGMIDEELEDYFKHEQHDIIYLERFDQFETRLEDLNNIIRNL